MFVVVAADVGELYGIACSVGVDGDGRGGKSVLPAVHQALDSLNQTVLRDGVEETTHQVVVDSVEVHAIWSMLEVVVKVVPQLWY